MNLDIYFKIGFYKFTSYKLLLNYCLLDFHIMLVLFGEIKFCNKVYKMFLLVILKMMILEIVKDDDIYTIKKFINLRNNVRLEIRMKW